MGRSSIKKKACPLVFAEVEEAWEKAYLQRRFRHHPGGVRFFREPADEIVGEIRDAALLSVFIKSRVNRNVIARLPKLQMITTRSTGYDHIDLPAARKRKIVVSNVPTYGENTVAEHVFALILSLSRNLRRSYERTVRGDFSLKGLMGFDLKDKTLGVIGTGHIGLHVIRIALGFGMRVIAYDVKRNDLLAGLLNFQYQSLEEVLKKSDILSLHVPYLESTHHLINRKTIRLIKKGAVLINTSRGGLVQTEALVEALNSGILAGAGLDVLENEEFVLDESRLLQDASSEHWGRMQTVLHNHVLLKRENVVYTPHLAFFSREALERILETTAESIEAFLDGRASNRVA